jgi:hypothetical protein
MGGSLPPAADVDAADLADREHGSFDSAEHQALGAGQVVGEVGWGVVVGAGLEDEDEARSRKP